MSLYTVFWLMPSIPAVSFTENASRGSFPSPSGTLGFRTCGTVSDVRLVTSRFINFSQSSPAMVIIPVMVTVNGFFRSLFIRGK